MNRLQEQYLLAAYELAKDDPVMHAFNEDEVTNYVDLDTSEQGYAGRSIALTQYHLEKGFLTPHHKGQGTGRRVLRITREGIEEAEKLNDPIEQRKALRKRFLRVAYELAEEQPSGMAMMTEVAPRLGMDPNDFNEYGKLTDLAKYFVERGYARRQFAGFEVISLTAKGIDAVEGNTPVTQPSSVVYNIGLAQGSIIGNQQQANLTTSFDSVKSDIQKHGGNDATALLQMMNELEEMLDRGKVLSRGQLAEYGELMERNEWIVEHVVNNVMRFATFA
jgi:hypothetical protein